MNETKEFQTHFGGKNIKIPVVLRGAGLSIDEVVQVARFGAAVRLTDDPNVLQRMAASHDYILKAVQSGRKVYGVTTGFGGMANTIIF